LEKNTFEDYLKNRYQGAIKWYDKKSQQNKKRYDVFQWVLIISSSITPVLIAINFGLSEFAYLKWVAVIVAVVVTISASSIRIFRFHDNWVSYRTTCETLKKELYMHQAGIGEYRNSADKDSIFVERVEILISQENTLWLTIFKNEEKIK
jgi:hypothetical protein